MSGCEAVSETEDSEGVGEKHLEKLRSDDEVESSTLFSPRPLVGVERITGILRSIYMNK